ncbi:hypothetical protein FSP39_023713 [Pinctada imbricata]|uniref:RING-type domain-containing protein n=1 Tax=Pinctada imbricata TaxID=66713 RepID=A0AA89BMH2_PINIB|nr:hypothetical protein FSP39_023713 [Pinctada imbricata]
MGFCSICFESLKRPTCCIPCGHVFCSACIRRWESQANRQRSFSFGYPQSFTCPQCRCDIYQTQNIRFDDTETDEAEEEYSDPWDQPDDYSNIVHSLSNIWSQSQIRHMCVRWKESLFAHTWIRKTWDFMKFCGNSSINFISDFQQVQGGPERKLSWLKDKGKEKYEQVKSRIINHHRIATLRTQWSNLHDDKKFGITLAAFIILVLILADAQNADGFLQAVVFPIINAVISIGYEILSCLTFCMVRPIVCSARCLLEVGLSFLEMFFTVVKAPVEIMIILILLPRYVLLGLFSFTTNVLFALMKTVLPLFVLVYFLSPDVQRRCHEMFAHLQNNLQNGNARNGHAPNDQPQQQN